MQIKLLRGGTARLNLSRFRLLSESKSKFQHRVGQLLVAMFPHDRIFEEVAIPDERFVLDFFIPAMGLVIECQGRQHGEFIPYFHDNRQQFHRQQDRDCRKRRWCELNHLKLVEIPPGAKDDAIACLIVE